MSDPNTQDPTDPRTIVTKFLDGLKATDVQQYIRVALYALSGAAASYGFVVPGQYQSLLAWGVAVISFAGSLAWAIWGNQVVLRIKRLMETGQVASLQANSTVIANAIPDGRVTSAAATIVIPAGNLDEVQRTLVAKVEAMPGVESIRTIPAKSTSTLNDMAASDEHPKVMPAGPGDVSKVTS